MRSLRDGVKLKKVHERQYNPLPIEFSLTPYEMLMDDIRSQRYKLRKVMVSVAMEKDENHFLSHTHTNHRQTDHHRVKQNLACMPLRGRACHIILAEHFVTNLF